MNWVCFNNIHLVRSFRKTVRHPYAILKTRRRYQHKKTNHSLVPGKWWKIERCSWVDTIQQSISTRCIFRRRTNCLEERSSIHRTMQRAWWNPSRRYRIFTKHELPCRSRIWRNIARITASSGYGLHNQWWPLRESWIMDELLWKNWRKWFWNSWKS